MASCYICKKHVTTGLVVCQECARGQAGTRFAQMTATPEALAAWLDKIWSSRDHFCFDKQFCKSDCDNIDDCQHELECIVAWLREPASEDAHREILQRSPQPLTLSELQQMDGEPVYLVDELCPQKNGWRILNSYPEYGDITLSGPIDTICAFALKPTMRVYRSKLAADNC